MQFATLAPRREAIITLFQAAGQDIRPPDYGLVSAGTLFRSPCAILRVYLTGHFACNIVLLLPIDSLKCQTAASSVLLAAGLSDRFASAGGKFQGELNSNEKCFYWQPEFRHE